MIIIRRRALSVMAEMLRAEAGQRVTPTPGTLRASLRAGDVPSSPLPSRTGFWPSPHGGNWEGGFTDTDGNHWAHVPWQGWKITPPIPFLRSLPRRGRWWQRILRWKAVR